MPFPIGGRVQSHPVLQAFISLLSLPDSRFVSEDVLALLDVPVLAARFTINEDGLRYLRLWVNESGIRWGIDDGQRARAGTSCHGAAYMAILA
ncbi:exonuclease V subunit [Salmonella enterica subsp. enterica serovar Daytona]|uniref:Exonuclease V subunit n=1 Tax=Salmonella enterica subsp. enterica serovar Daytona TaxID=1962639 RepID=A0A447JD27_SALET|nr:exonuclease V subunit [Salmonella enterica subsp. enterica serovar Daytona]